jgi:hypothetical protein
MSSVIEWLILPLTLIELMLKIHRALKIFTPPLRYGILSLLRNRVELSQVYETIKSVDEKLLIFRPYINNMPFDKALRESASDLLTTVRGKYYNLLRLMNLKKISGLYLNCIYAKPILTVSVKRDLNQINFIMSGEAKVTLDNPTLLWECHCNVPRKYVRSKLPCRIHAQDTNNIITNAFRTGLVEIEYNGLKIYWKNLRTLWPPSIDSLYFAHVIDKHIPSKQLRNVLDLGSGTGFLGIYLFNKKGIMNKLVLSDLFLLPLFSSLYNAYINLNPDLFRMVKITASNGLDYFIEQNKDKFDLILCAPPYLPHLGVHSILSLDAVSGTYLMEDAIVRAGILSDSLIICYSSLAEPEFKKAIDKARSEMYSRLDVTDLYEVEVPFRVLHALSNEEYMAKILSERKKFLKKGPHDSPFRYWHKIKYCLINYRT